MRVVSAVFGMLLTDEISISWGSDWAWGLPLIVLTVLIHVLGLGLIRPSAVRASAGASQRRHPTLVFVIVIGTTTLLATCLHAFEAGLWAVTYKRLGALPDFRTSMLYSLNAITSYGHTNLALPDRWHMMGAMEALNGWLLFGLTTAFLFGMIDNLWLMDARKERR